MDNSHMSLLDEGCIGAGNGQVMIDHVAQLAGTCTRQTNGPNTQRGCGLYRRQHILGISAGGNGCQDIARSPHSLNLAGEDLLKAEVVTEAGEHGCIYCQGHGGPTWTFAPEASYQLSREVLG